MQAAGQGRFLAGGTFMVRLFYETFLSLVFLVGLAIGSTIALVNPGLMEKPAFRIAFILLALCIPAGLAMFRWGLARIRKDTLVCGGGLYGYGKMCEYEPHYHCYSCYRPLCEIHAAFGHNDPHIYCLDCLTPDTLAGERMAR